MKKVLIAGGGISGLTAAVFLSDFAEVTLIESSPKLGGRAYSFFDKTSGLEYDNGQHLLLNCYDYTFKFFEKIDCLKNFEFMPELRIPFVTKDGKIHYFSTEKYFYPFNLLNSLIKFDLLSFPEKLKISLLLFKILFYEYLELGSETVNNWLIKEGQSEHAIKTFWEVLAIGILNADLNISSAVLFKNVMKKIFSGKNTYQFVYPKKGLSSSYVNNAVNYILDNKGSINFSESLIELKPEKKRITKIKTSRKTYENFDFIISALPFYAVKNLNLNLFRTFENELISSAILSVHLKTNKKFTEKHYAFIDSPVHWVFNKNGYISVTISNADNISRLSNEEIICLIATELEKYLQLSRAEITEYKIIREKRATFIPTGSFVNNRPEITTEFRNLFLAGDYVNTGYPSTIESASKSGFLAAEKIIRQI